MNKFINTVEYLTLREYQKYLEKEWWNNLMLERGEEREEEALLLKNIPQDLRLYLIDQGYEYTSPNYFRRRKEINNQDVDISLQYNDNTNKFRVITCTCQIACCGRNIGEVKLEGIDKLLEDWYKDE